MIRPKQMARIGVFHLTEAVMDILTEYHKKDGATPALIGKKLGLYRGSNPNDGYVWNALREIEDQKIVKRYSKKEGGSGKWCLVDKEYEKRRDDIVAGKAGEMIMIRPKQMARIGVFHLTEAVMDILAQSHKKNGATPSQIGKKLGLCRGSSPNDGYVWNALRELENQKIVKRHSKKEGGKGEWLLTAKEYEQRRDDV